jgi:hypothetical protein
VGRKVAGAPASERLISMFDSVTVGDLPRGELAYAGYVDGQWPTWDELRAWAPRARLVSIAVHPASRALILDVESGDAGPQDVAGFVRAGHERGLWAPGFYTSLVNVGEVLDRLHSAGIPRNRFRVWTAHWTGVAHLCSPACAPTMNTTAGATQYLGASPSTHFDVSVCSHRFLPIPGADER